MTTMTVTTTTITTTHFSAFGHQPAGGLRQEEEPKELDDTWRSRKSKHVPVRQVDSDNNNDDTNGDVERRCSLSYDLYLLLQVDNDSNNNDTKKKTLTDGVLYLTIYIYFFR